MTSPPPADRATASARRPGWRLGALTLIAVAVVVIGVVLLDDSGGEPGAVTVPTIPGLLGGPQFDGDVAPDFSVELFDGTRFRLSTHLAEDGRPVLLNLWASWCTPCRAEMPDLDEAARNHPEILFLGVAVDDDPVAAEEFAIEIGVTYPLGADEADRVGRAYPSPGLPATYFITSEGGLARTVYGEMDTQQLDALIEAAFGTPADDAP